MPARRPRARRRDRRVPRLCRSRRRRARVRRVASAPMVARQLAEWAAALEPTAEDQELARRSLVDTAAVNAAARDHPIGALADRLGPAGRWAVLAHVLDFDDLHMESTTHISAVCVPAALATGGGARAYLAGAGVMARLGVALGLAALRAPAGTRPAPPARRPRRRRPPPGWVSTRARSRSRWRSRCPPPAACTVRSARRRSRCRSGFAVDAGVRAAELAAAGATADPAALDQWLALVGGDPGRLEIGGPAVPGGLAIKLYPCCYALQRPIAAARELSGPAERRDPRHHARRHAAAADPRPPAAPASRGSSRSSTRIAAALLDERPGLRELHRRGGQPARGAGDRASASRSTRPPAASGCSPARRGSRSAARRPSSSARRGLPTARRPPRSWPPRSPTAAAIQGSSGRPHKQRSPRRPAALCADFVVGSVPITKSAQAPAPASARPGRHALGRSRVQAVERLRLHPVKRGTDRAQKRAAGAER